jgi:hypothetical protein
MCYFVAASSRRPDMNAIQDQINSYGALLSEWAGTTFEGINKYDAGQLPYRWEFRTTIEPIEYVASVELTTDDILAMNGMNTDAKRTYLGKRFAHLFTRP